MSAFDLCLQKRVVSNLATLTEQSLAGLSCELSKVQLPVLVLAIPTTKGFSSR